MKCRAGVKGRFRNCRSCGRRKLKVTRETYDAVDHVVVGHQRCTVCRQGHLFARRLTLAESRVVQHHLQPMRKR